MSAATLRPPEAAGMGRGFAFALAAHVLLFIALSAGVSWRNQATPAFEAELWSTVPVAAAPREESPPPEPPPQAQPDRRAEPQRAAEEEQAQRDAEIAVARDRARKEREKREQQERDRKAAEAKLEKERQAKLEKEKADKAEKDKLAKAAEAKREREREAKLEAMRQDQLKRIQGLAGATGAPNATGSAQQSAGPSASYAGRIKARIKPLIIYTDPGGPEPYAEVLVTAGPDGRIFGTKLTKPSGNAEWDRAILRAIEKAEYLPRNEEGRVPSPIELGFRPRE